jgi:hypothetical protein
MRDADHLPVTPDLLHLLAHGMRRFASDIRIDLIEDQNGI